MSSMSAFRCSMFKIYTHSLVDILNTIISSSETIHYENISPNVSAGLRERIKKIELYVNNDCCCMELSEVDEALFDIESVIKILKLYHEEKTDTEERIMESINKCIDVIRQMREIIKRDSSIEQTTPYPGGHEFPEKLEEMASRQFLAQKLSKEEKEILQYLRKNGKEKTLSEIARELGVNPYNLHKYLKKLAMKGRIKRRYDEKRRKVVYHTT